MKALEEALLSALVSGAGYGLELAERAMKGKPIPTAGRLYSALRGLEAKGLVVSSDVPDEERPGRVKRVYRLSDEGWRRVAEKAG